MDIQRETARISFFILSITGTLVVLIEVAMNLSHTSLCISTGCKIVANQVRYGNLTILLLGAATFLLLSILSRPSSSKHRRPGEQIVSMILCSAIASEGFLVGYQVFRVYALCWFCLGVFALFALMGILWILSGHWEVTTGFAGFFTILALFYLILPVPTSGEGLGDHIGQSRLTLFYSRACKSCDEIETLCKDSSIVINRVDADEHFDLLEQMDIYEIPVLLVNDPEEKRFMIGKKKILEYLSEAK